MDYSLGKLLLVPVLALAAAVSLPYVVFWMWGLPDNPWISAAVKLLLFSGTYVLIWLPLEWSQTRRMLSAIRRTLGRKDVQGPVIE